MVDREHHMTLADPATGATEMRRPLRDDEIAFSVRMALMQKVWHGLPHKSRDAIKDSIAEAVVEQFRLSGYVVLSKMGEAQTIRGTPYMGIERKS